jgi:hypothetical protein
MLNSQLNMWYSQWFVRWFPSGSQAAFFLPSVGYLSRWLWTLNLHITTIASLPLFRSTTMSEHLVLHQLSESLVFLRLAAFILAFVIASALYALYTSQQKKRLPLPPGPRPWPILGNALDLPSESSWLTYTEWKKTYGKLTPHMQPWRCNVWPIVDMTGDVIYVQALGRPIVILNSYKAAHDLLDKKVSYADRPKFHMVGELWVCHHLLFSATSDWNPVFPTFVRMGWERYIPATQYGDKLRQFRRMMHGFMSKGAVDRFWPVQQAEVRFFLKTLLRRPEDFLEQFRV